MGKRGIMVKLRQFRKTGKREENQNNNILIATATNINETFKEGSKSKQLIRVAS